MGTPRVHLGANWVPMGPKMGQNRKNLQCQKNSNCRLRRGHRFFTTNRNQGYGAKSRWGPPRVRLGANGVPLGPKMGQNRKNLLCSAILIFDYPAVIDFSQNIEVTVMAPNHGGETLGSILGPIGSHWVKNGSKPKILTMFRNSNFRLHRGHRFLAKNGSNGYGTKSRWGPPRVHLGANRVPLGKKMSQNG